MNLKKYETFGGVAYKQEDSIYIVGARDVNANDFATLQEYATKDGFKNPVAVNARKPSPEGFVDIKIEENLQGWKEVQEKAGK